MSATLDRTQLQGNILRGYGRPCVRHLLLAVAAPAAARNWLGATVSGQAALAPQITTEAPWDGKPDACFNLGFTAEGLRLLGLPAASLASFPEEFRAGMASRAVKLGDTGGSAPQHWAPPFDQPAQVHLMASIHAGDAAHLDRVQQQVLGAGDGRALRLLGVRDGLNFDGDQVHFGYRDNISQPRFSGIHDPLDYPDAQPLAPLGTVLLGHKTAFEGLTWRVPEPEVLGLNGSFSAFRVLAQDVAGFEAYLDQAATDLLAHLRGEELLAPAAPWVERRGLSRHSALREVVAAKMCGRWRNGVPLALSPDSPDDLDSTHPVPLGDFDHENDNTGVRCPYGAHTRRCNPRGSMIVQRMANHTRRLVRRGVPYGPVYDPARPDGVERGLLGNFLCANLAAQFEALLYDWLNLGLQDPRLTGSNDPLLGANDAMDSWFDIPIAAGGVIRLRGLPRFVTTRGGAYLFLPSLPALRHLATLRP